MKNPLFAFAACLRHAFMTGAGYEKDHEPIEVADLDRWANYDPPSTGSFKTMADVLAAASDRSDEMQLMTRKETVELKGLAKQLVINIDEFETSIARVNKAFAELLPPVKRSTTGVVIVAAAIRIHANGSDFVVSVPRPGRHHDIHNAEAFPLEYAYTEGFLTSAGTFVDRENALELAIKAGQFNAPAEGKRELFSEDLW
jgi:hypothetical protein